jgi:hypothetical protein
MQKNDKNESKEKIYHRADGRKTEADPKFK